MMQLPDVAASLDPGCIFKSGHGHGGGIDVVIWGAGTRLAAAVAGGVLPLRLLLQSELA